MAGLLVTVIEKWLTKRIPPAAYTFVVPFACVVCTVIAVYLLVGSAARIVEQGLVRAVNFILGDEAMKAAGGFVMGVITVPLMALGIHLALVPVQLQQIAAGESALWPIQVSSVLACGGAALAIFLLSKKEEEIHGPAREGVLITLGLGTVEPALFGVCCRRKEAMAGAVIASGLAGLVGRLTDCYSTSFGVNGFFSFLNLPMEKWVQYALMLGVSVIGSLTLTLLFASMRKR